MAAIMLAAAGDSGVLSVSIWSRGASRGVDFLLSPALCLSLLLNPCSLEGLSCEQGRSSGAAGTLTGADGGRKVKQKMLHEGKETDAGVGRLQSAV